MVEFYFYLLLQEIPFPEEVQALQSIGRGEQGELLE